MKQLSMVCIGVLLATEAFICFASAASARSSQPKEMTTGDLATLVCDFDVYALADDSGRDFWRPRFSPECSIERWHRYGAPCNSPVCDY